MLSDFVCNFAFSVITLFIRMQSLRQVKFPDIVKAWYAFVYQVVRYSFTK